MSKSRKKIDRQVISKKHPELTENQSGLLTPTQQRKQDALELAELIYDIFKDSLSNAKISGENREDDQGV